MHASLKSLKGPLRFLSTRIGRRSLAVFVGISVLPLLVIGLLLVRNAETAVRQQTEAVLRVAADGAEAEVREFLGNVKREMLEMAGDQRIAESLTTANASAVARESRSGNRGLSELLRGPRKRIPGIREVLVLDHNGRVVACSGKDRIGEDYSTASFFRKGQRGFDGGEVVRAGGDEVTWTVSAPVKTEEDVRSPGVVAFRFDATILSDLTTGQRALRNGANTQSFRIGKTGETYLVNRQRLMITESRSVSDAVLRARVDTLPVREAFERGQEITGDYLDYRNIEVSGASAILRDFDWVVVSEIDFSQVFERFQRRRTQLLATVAGLGVLAVLLAWSSTRRIIQPIQMLSESDRALMIGDTTGALVPEAGLPEDELGELVRRRNSRVREALAYQQRLGEQAAQLREALEEMEAMSYSIMHDMRAPLRAIIGFGDLLREKSARNLDPESQECLQHIRSASVRMDCLIRDVLDYSVLARAELPLHPVNASELLRGIVETYPALQEYKAMIKVPPDLPPVQSNQAALTQCFANLLDNAVKFAQPGRTVRIRVNGERLDGWVRISVEDNGVGIPETMQKRIFGIFQRGANAGAGTGIGLAIVRKAVQRMQGRVGFASELGKGSCFWVELRPA